MTPNIDGYKVWPRCKTTEVTANKNPARKKGGASKKDNEKYKVSMPNKI